MASRLIIVVLFSKVLASKSHCGKSAEKDSDDEYCGRIQRAKLDLWRRGEFSFPWIATNSGSHKEQALQIEQYSRYMSRMNPIKRARQAKYSSEIEPFFNLLKIHRGGETESYEDMEQAKIKSLALDYGAPFIEAIEKNRQEHAEDCKKSCTLFYCAKGADQADAQKLNYTFRSYSMGAVPPEDFAPQFGFPLDLIKVSEQPIVSPTEAAEVVAIAEMEGLSSNEYRSGKYKLGGNWLDDLPKTRSWFNDALKTRLFPLLHELFPEVVSSPSVLRAHSVSLLKYNETHPRTDVHIDNGILAMTISMNPSNQYNGGGTFFEHMGNANVIEMDVGYGTFRPGSVRHGGAPVTHGQRYILGAFILLEDKVEHVRRLKNRGSDLREQSDLEGAARHFEWALGLNSKCTTCLKDWAEVLLAQKQYSQAEAKIREALFLLENKDSDALFTLGLLLSEQGKDNESIDAYQQSIELNAEDAELCYNLGIKLGSVRRDVKAELEMYKRATEIDRSMGGAWINWGTSLAEQGDLDGAEQKFKSALEHDPRVAIKALMNLSLSQARANQCAAVLGDMDGAKSNAEAAGSHLDAAKYLIDQLTAKDKEDPDMIANIKQYTPLRLGAHKMLGQVLAGMGDMTGCESEFRLATKNFETHPGAWEMLSLVLQRLGKVDEAKEIQKKVEILKAL